MVRTVRAFGVAVALCGCTSRGTTTESAEPDSLDIESQESVPDTVDEVPPVVVSTDAML